MTKVEDFENAPVGATATNADGSRAMKMDDSERSWILPTGLYYDDEEMMILGYMLEPPAPTTAREALDLAWELAHEVKEGQVIPKGTHILRLVEGQVRVFQNGWDFDEIAPLELPYIRTLVPLPNPEPKPDWLDAPAVLARVDGSDLQPTEVYAPTGLNDRWIRVGTQWTFHWSDLVDVTPLYPKETEA